MGVCCGYNADKMNQIELTQMKIPFETQEENPQICDESDHLTFEREVLLISSPNEIVEVFYS